jgi:hypothetical protein
MAKEHVLGCPRHDEAGTDAIEAAERLLAVARTLKGVACKGCSGFGNRTYGDTSTWRGGAGGQAMTVGVCDKCWGTGRTDRTGVNLRKLGMTT